MITENKREWQAYHRRTKVTCWPTILPAARQRSTVYNDGGLAENRPQRRAVNTSPRIPDVVVSVWSVLQQPSSLLKSPLATPSCCALKPACRHRCRTVTVTLLTDVSSRSNACLPTNYNPLALRFTNNQPACYTASLLLLVYSNVTITHHYITSMIHSITVVGVCQTPAGCGHCRRSPLLLLPLSASTTQQSDTLCRYWTWLID